MPAVIDESTFQTNFEGLVTNLKRYILSAKGKNYVEGDQGTILLLMNLSEMCSSKQGAQGATPLVCVELVIRFA